MKRVFSHPVTAIVLGFLLRLLFLLRLPSTAGDTSLYETLSENWVERGVYGMPVNGVLTPVDIRMPGYPATTLLGAALMAAVLLTTAFTDAFRPTLVFGLPFLAALVVCYRLWHRRAEAAAVSSTESA